jgi:hypothetical protein
MDLSKLVAISVFFVTCHLASQTVPTKGESFQLHGKVERQNGMVKLTVSSPWPVEQGMSAVRREFGLLLDYEEGSSTYQANSTRARSLKSDGRFVIQVPETSLASGNDRERFIKDILEQFYAQGGLSFTVLSGVNDRLTVAPSSSSDRLLDTPIIVRPERRTIEQTVEAILGQVSRQRGVSIVRGGLIDNDLENKEIVVGSATAVAARSLLAQALDGASDKRYWLFGWDPSLRNYVLAIQTAVRLEKAPTGQTFEVPIR